MKSLPLKGERKKPDSSPRTEGLCKLKGRKNYYARLYKPGKRAKYLSTHYPILDRAQALLPHLRAALLRGQTGAEALRAINHQELPL